MAAGPEINSCEEVTPALIDAAFTPKGASPPAQQVLRLLDRMAKVATPKAGAHRILQVLARLAQADWINGQLEVTLSDFGVATEIDVRVDDGRMAARWRSFSVAVPLSEFSQWVRQWPSAIRPLSLFGEPVPDRLQLRAQRAPSAPEPRPNTPAAASGSSAVSARRADLHRKETARRDELQLPKEAYRMTPPLFPATQQSDSPASAGDSEPPVPVEEEGWD